MVCVKVKVASLNWDRFGTWASAMCAVHCLLTGFALGLMSIVGLDFIGSPLTEAAFVLAAATLGSLAVYHGAKKHHSIVPALIFVGGMAFVAGSHFLFGHGTPGGAIMSIAGGLCLVSFHFVNFRLQHGCDCGNCVHTAEVRNRESAESI
jgi:hypothetical protein